MKISMAVKACVLMLIVSGCVLPQALAQERLTNPVSGYNVTLDPNQNGTFLGWIELLNGKSDAGYVYFEDPPSPPHLSSKKTYIVMSFQPSFFDSLRSILRSEKQITISFFDCQCGGTPSAMIDTGTAIFVATAGSLLRVNPDELRHIKARLKRSN